MDNPPVQQQLSRIEQLPDDVLVLIISSLPTLAEIARTSLLSRRWKYVWHAISRLDFDTYTMLPIARSKKSFRLFQAWVNSVLAVPTLSPVKHFRICYNLTSADAPQVDPWIDFALSNPLETLYLDFGFVPCGKQYKLSVDCWRRDPSRLSGLKSLTFISVGVTKQLIELVLSTCPLLEDLYLNFVGFFTNFDISGHHLRRLTITGCRGIALNKLSAPSLTYFFYSAYCDGFNPKTIDAPILTDLTIGGKMETQPIMEYLEPISHLLPQLEKLNLIMEENETFMLNQIPLLVNLKYLKMSFKVSTDSIWDQIIYFLNACPVLETFVFQILLDGDVVPDQISLIKQWARPFQGNDVMMRFYENKIRQHTIEKQSKWINAEEGCSGFTCLKVLELHVDEGKLIDQELVRFIVNKARNLEKFIIHTCLPSWPSSWPPMPISFQRVEENVEPKDIKAIVEAKAKEICPPRIQIHIVG